MLSDNDLELLSAYIDGALSETERAALDARLRAEPELRRELARLQAAVDLVKSLPPLSAPRDFRLSRSMARRPSVWTSAAFSYASAAAAVFLLIVGVILFRQPGNVPLPAAVSNVAALPTGAATLATKLGDEEADNLTVPADDGTVGGEVAQSPGEARDLAFAATTATPQSTAAPQMYAVVAPTASASAGLLSDAFQDSAAAADQARTETQTEMQAAAPSVPSAASGAAAAEAPLPAPTLLPPTPTQPPTATPTPVPSRTPTPPPTATPAPTFTPTPVPPASILDEPGAVGGGLIVVALILLVVAGVTTLARRRA